MIYSHLPEDVQWQLLSCPISMEQFLKLPQLRSGFFDLQLELVSPCRTNMITFDPHRALAEVLIRAPADVYLMCSIARDATSGLAQYDSDRNLWQCLFRPHSSGYKTLDVFARQGRRRISYKAVLESQLNMIDMVRFDKFPVTYEEFTERKCQIFGPLIGKLKQGSEVTIHCRIPGARCVRLKSDGALTLEKYNLVNDIFEEQIIVPNRDVVVYVQFADGIESSSYIALFKYAVE